MQSTVSPIPTTSKHMLSVAEILIYFHRQWWWQPNTIQPLRTKWWTVIVVEPLNVHYANKIVFDIWKCSQKKNELSKKKSNQFRQREKNGLRLTVACVCNIGNAMCILFIIENWHTQVFGLCMCHIVCEN